MHACLAIAGIVSSACKLAPVLHHDANERNCNGSVGLNVSGTLKCGSLRFIFTHPPEDKKKKKRTCACVLVLVPLRLQRGKNILKFSDDYRQHGPHEAARTAGMGDRCCVRSPA